MKNKYLLTIPMFCTLFSLATTGCGGGGGGGTPFYGGIWRFRGLKVVDTCRISNESVFSTTLTVNQIEDRVVVDSGRVVLEGNTNEEDGFNVSNSSENGNCRTISQYQFKDASDGDAEAVLAITTTCGVARCELGFAGNAERSSGKSSSDNEESRLEEIIADAINATLSFNE